MSRPLRVEFPGAVYHLTSRGNARQKIFWNDDDRKLFLSTLAQVVKRFGWLCHAYCLMNNHCHLLVETPRANLSLGMRQLNGVYTQAFNRRHKRVGHLFQGRFKAILLQKESHLLELCRYVVLNPLRIKAKTRVREWRWSSYRATAGLEAAPDFLTVDWILSQFGQKRRQAQMKYREFVADGLDDRPWEKLRGQIFLGSEEFISRHRSRTKDEIKEVPRAQRKAVRPSLEQILGKKAAGRSVEIAYREYGYRLNEIAQHLGVHYATVSRRLKALESKRQ
jgi:REP element-mobilizing transposase RayT